MMPQYSESATNANANDVPKRVPKKKTKAKRYHSDTDLPVQDDPREPEPDAPETQEKYEHVERFLSAGRRYRQQYDHNDPQHHLERYDHNRTDFFIVFFMAIVFALAIIVLAVLPFFVQITEDQPAGKINATVYTGISTHHLCMILSLLILSSFGILLYRLLPEVNAWYIKYYHFAIFTVITGVMTYGVAQMVLIHDELSVQHFGTLHSWLGLATAFLYYVEYLTGLIYLVGIPVRCDFLGPTFQRFHKTLGLIVLFLSGVTVVTGINQAPLYLTMSTSVKTISSLIVLNIQGLLAAFFCVATGIMLFVHQFRRRSRPKWKCIYDNTVRSVRDHESSKTLISKKELFKKLIEGPSHHRGPEADGEDYFPLIAD